MDRANPFDTGLQPDEAHGRLVTAPWGTFGLFRRSDGVLVGVDAWCPHIDGPLWQGTLGGADELVCPWHAWRFSLHTGACTWAPPMDCEEAVESVVRLCATELSPRGTVVLLPPA